MEKEIHIGNLHNILRQRNLFLSLTLALVLSNLFLALKILVQNERVILVPAIKQQMWMSRNMVSSSYLEEITNIYLTNLLDINSKNISYKKSLIMTNVSSEKTEYAKQILKYFANAESKYKQFDLTTYFTVNNIEIDVEKLETIASGILTSSYGKKGVKVSEEKYHLTFEYRSGFLKLKSFTRIIG